MNFTNPQPVTKNVGRNLWELTEDWVGYFELQGVWYRLRIYAGFVYDGASIPRIAWSILGKTPRGQHDSGTIFHDLVYMVKDGMLGQTCSHSLHMALPSGWDEVTALNMTRAEADAIMFQIIRNTRGVEVGWRMNRRLNIMHRFIRIFGRGAWMKTTPNKILNPKRCD